MVYELTVTIILAAVWPLVFMYVTAKALKKMGL